GDARRKKKVKIPKKPSYVGAAKCDSSCHDPWYQAWTKSPHGRTYDLLKPGIRAEAKKKAKLDPDKDYTADPKCLRCHTTGYRQKGGFVPGETKIDPDEPNLEQVGCEMCHSAKGGAQFRAFMKKTEGKFKRTEVEGYGMRYDFKNVCSRCHEHKNTPFKPSLDKKYEFNFEERKKKVHLYKDYYNKDNKDQTHEIEHGVGLTESKPLEIEDWVIKDGKLRFTALPWHKGKPRYKK
ncbi:hypothetical protein MNBD_NITROSPINAE02-154, partial [hydrothermal vent metagenome]